GESQRLFLRVKAPREPGVYVLELAMVREQVCWYPPPLGQARLAQVRVLPRLPFLVGGLGLFTGLLSLLVWKGRRWASWLVPVCTVLWLVAFAWVGGQVVVVAGGLVGPAMPVGMLWAGGCWLSLALILSPCRWWPRLGTLLAFLVAVLAFADTLYLRFFGSIVSLLAWQGAGQLGQVWDSVRSLAKPQDLWFAVLGFWAFFPWLWPRWQEQWPLWGRFLRRAAIAGVLLAAAWPVVAAVRGVLRDVRGAQVFSYTMRMQELGVWGLHLLDAARTWKEAVSEDLAPEEKQQIREFFAQRAKTTQASGPAFGRFSGYNLILLQVESLQNFVVGLEVNGQEVTPFLNSLRRRGLYFSWVCDQTNQGRSSDGEFIALNSQHALAEGAVAFRRAGNHFMALPQVLRSRGYHTLSAHAFERGFWNRAVLHPAYGFERSFFKRELGPGEVIGWGLADGVFLQRVLPLLKEARQPFFAFLITLGLHHPFDQFPEGRKSMKLPDLGDPALAAFLEGLARAGLAERTVVALYGDHEAGFPLQAPLANLLRIQWSPQQLMALRRVPFFIVAPDATMAGEVDEVGGQVDIAPTLLHLLGVPRPFWFVGRALIPGRQAFAALPDGSGANHELLWVEASQACADRQSLQARPASQCEALRRAVAAELAASRAVVEHDLLPDIAGP
ncbi:MAG: LTA synthase family protein, partial [Thermoanaerobaculum sp.]